MMQQQLAAAGQLDCPTVHQQQHGAGTAEGALVMIEQEERPQTTDSADTRESLTSLVDLSGAAGGGGFSRDQPGRQSMSEKRHATLDAKATDTYQKRKKARDDRLRREQGRERQREACQQGGQKKK